MTESAPPPKIIDHARGGRRSRLLEWQHRHDGWWARVSWPEPNMTWSKHAQPFNDREEWRTTDQITPIPGENYTHVPRTQAVNTPPQP